MQEIGQPGDIERILKIDLEEETVADMVTIEGNPLNQGDMCNKCGLPVVGVAVIADCQGMIDREMESADCRAYCEKILVKRSSVLSYCTHLLQAPKIHCTRYTGREMRRGHERRLFGRSR